LPWYRSPSRDTRREWSVQRQMTAKQSDVAEHLEALFKNLDAAQLAPKTILKSKAHKEHYETM
jgi:hypothetical protein